MTGDDDLAKLLPPSPPPRPDRREAAIEAAMRGHGGTSAPAPGVPRRSGPRRSWIANRPLVGALASLALVVSITIPVWMGGDHGPGTTVTDAPRRDAAGTEAGTQAKEREAESAAVADQPVARARKVEPIDDAPRTTAVPSPRDRAVPPPVAADDGVAPPDEAAFALAAPPPSPPPPPPPPPPAPAIVAAPSAARASGDGIVVTGARVTIDREGLARSQARSAPRRAAWPDPNRCTVADPRRDIEACRTVIEEAVPLSARPYVLDGVSRAWRGDLNGAAAALDRAAARAPRSAFVYYNRSLVLSRRDDKERARADRERAIDLDDRYRSAPPSGE